MKMRDAFQWDAPETQREIDYADRTDGQPVYRGHAKIDISQTDPHWTITFSLYDTDGNLTSSKTKCGSWTGRVALFI